MKKTKKTILALILVIIVGLTAACGNNNKVKVPDPTPETPPVATKYTLEITFDDDEELADNTFAADDQSSMNMEIADGKATFKIIGDGYDGAAYGSYWMNFDVNTKDYKYLVFDIDSMRGAAGFKVQFRDVGDIGIVIPVRQRAGKAYCDLSKLPSKYQGAKVPYTLALYFNGTESGKSQVILNGIYNTNDEPIVLTAPSEIDFTGDEQKAYFFDMGDGNVDVSIDSVNGRGKFDITGEATTGDPWGAIGFDFKINTSINRYLTLDIEYATDIAIKYGYTDSEGVYRDIQPIASGTISKTVLYGDLNTLPDEVKGKEVVITLRLCFAGTTSSATLNKISLSNTTDNPNPEPEPEEAEKLDIDFTTAEDGKYFGDYDAVYKAQATAVVNSEDGNVKITRSGTDTDTYGVIYFKAKLNTLDYKYLVFDVGESTFDGTKAQLNQKPVVENYELWQSTKTGGVYYVDLASVNDVLKGKNIQVFISIFIIGQISENSSTVFNHIYQTNEEPVAPPIVANKLDLNFDSSADGELFGDYDEVTKAQATSSIDEVNHNLVITRSGSDTESYGVIYFNATLNTKDYKYLIFDIESGMYGGCNVQLNDTPLGIANESILKTSKKGGIYAFDLASAFPQVESQNIKLTFTIFIVGPTSGDYIGNLVINRIYQADVAPTAQFDVDFSSDIDKDMFPVVDNMDVKIDSSNSKITLTNKTGDAWTGITAVVALNTVDYKYLVFEVEEANFGGGKFQISGDFVGTMDGTREIMVNQVEGKTVYVLDLTTAHANMVGKNVNVPITINVTGMNSENGHMIIGRIYQSVTNPNAAV